VIATAAQIGERITREREVDLRLAAGAATAWLAVIVGLGRSPSAVATLGLSAATVGAGLLVLSRRGIAGAAALALVGFCIALVLLPLAARLARARDSPLAVLARDRVAVTAEIVVSSDPHPLAATGPAGSPRIAVDARVVSVIVGGRETPVGGLVLVLGPARGWRDILPGQRVRLDARLQPPLAGDLLTAVLEEQSDPVLLGQPPWWQQAAGAVRSSLRTASQGLPQQERGLLPGLIDGDTSGLDPVLAERFRIAGLTHLVAVSGTNCVIIVGAALLLLRRVGAGSVLCAVVGLVVLIAFVVVARPSPSVLRAAVMAAIALVALAMGRQRDGVPMVSAAVLGLLAWRPQLAVGAGFAMSVLATGALLLIAPAWAAALRRRRVPPFVAESAAVAAAAHVVTAPVIAALSGRVSLVAIPANVLAEPVVAPATVLGFAAAITAPWCLPLGAALAQLAGWPCRWLVGVAEFFGSRHGATVPWPSGIVGGLALFAVSVALLQLGRRAGARRLVVSAALIAVIVQLPVRGLVSGWPPPGWLLVACDVGQGDSIVLPAGAGSAVVVDAGPDPVAVDRCLADLHVHEVAMLLVSHYHVDHVGGIAGVFHDRRVARVITGPLAEPASGVEIVRNVLADRGLPVAPAAVGTTVDVGHVHLEVLAPVAAMHGTRSDPNNSSLIVRATVRGVRILLPGDAEVEEQQSVLDSGTDVSADVLKVPHHGSAYSDERFLRAVHAKVAVISVGLHNDYGHPSPLMLAELGKLGVPTRRTDHDGDVAVAEDAGHGLEAIVRGTRASTVGLGTAAGPGARTATTAIGPARRYLPCAGVSHAGVSDAARFAREASDRHATMSQCPRVHSTTSTSAMSFRPSCCCSARTSSSRPAPSSRSPPPRVRSIRTSTRTSGPEPRSERANWARCLALLCSGVGASSP
jgi:competence protein ComEC